MSVDREDPLLIGAIIFRLMCDDETFDVEDFAYFGTALECYGFTREDAYHIAHDIEEYYDENIR